jgi:hypothetical protein
MLYGAVELYDQAASAVTELVAEAQRELGAVTSSASAPRRGGAANRTHLDRGGYRSSTTANNRPSAACASSRSKKRSTPSNNHRMPSVSTSLV